MDEWKAARQVISDTEGELADLRKYGATFLAGLLTAQGIVEIPLMGATGYVPPLVKLVIVLSSQLLVCALFVLERPLRLIGRTAAHRAIVLEVQLNLGLTKEISASYRIHRPWNYIDGAYSVYLVAAGALGFFVLNPVSVMIGLPTLIDVSATIVSFVFVWVFGLRGSVRKRKTDSHPLASGPPADLDDAS
jgi:hypothetical protein